MRRWLEQIGRFCCWLLLCIVVPSGLAFAQQAPTDVYAAADRALADGDPDVAQRAILDIMQQQPTPLIQGTGALRLSQIAQLAGNLVAAEAPLQDALKLLPAQDPAAQPILAAIYVQIGALAMARGDMGRAQLALLKGIAITKHVTSTGDPQLLEAEIALATAEIRAFRLQQATDRLNDLAQTVAASTDRVAALYQAALGELNFRQYRFAPALEAQLKARDLFLSLYGERHAEVAGAETSLAGSLFNAGRYLEAERGLQQAITIYDRHADFYASALAATLVNLGQVYYTTGRLELAVSALSRGIDLTRKSLGAGSQAEAAALLHRGYARLRQGDLANAKVDLDGAIAMWSAPETRNERAAAGARIWLAETNRRVGDFPAAGNALEQAGAVLAQIFGPNSYAMTDVLAGKAEIAMAQNRPAEAIPFLEAAFEIRRQALGPDHIATLEIRSQLALALAASGNVASGDAMAAAVTGVVEQRLALAGAAQGGPSIDEVNAMRRLLGRGVAVIDYVLKGDLSPATRQQALDRSFALAQLARASAAGAAIAGLGQRQALSDPAAATALRKVQEAVLRWQMAERGLSTGAAAANDIEQIRADVERLEKTAHDLQTEFASAYPGLANLFSSSSVTSGAIQQSLRPNEALLAYLTLEDRSYVWLVAADRVALVPIQQSDSWLNAKIRALRMTVNPQDVQGLSDIRPFDVAAAADLYDALLAPLDLPPGIKHLVIVPDGTLQSLPFATLLSHHVEEPADFAAYRTLPWLIADRDITILPEIGAFTALRKSMHMSGASAPFLGIGDPVLTGETSSMGSNSSIADLLRGLAPLPESADELASLATLLKAGPGTILTGTKATEAALKTRPLTDYRTIAFATHGLMAGDFGRLREPGLVMTPPAIAEGDDDGLLTVGEIAQLKLDADWVVLSACNTAASDGSPGAEGLSGLARAFFFAGSRALLVSQWEVLSVAAVQLTTGTVAHLAETPEIGRAAALRLSMLALMAEDQPDYLAHPIFWAPFELVGEGGALP